MEFKYVIINFLILALGLFVFFRKTVINIFRGRREKILSKLDEADLIEKTQEKEHKEPVFEFTEEIDKTKLLEEKALAEEKITEIKAFGQRECRDIHRIMIERSKMSFSAL